MKFTKMHGAGNDYVYVNCFEENVPDAPSLARKISDRHFGVGSDGLILIIPSDEADFRMKIFNADGSEAEMCGNGIRCVAKFAYDNGMTDKNNIRVETGAGILSLELLVSNDRVDRVRVNMGQPILSAKDIPVVWSSERVVNAELAVKDRTFNITCVSMGNPHCVIFVDTLEDSLVTDYGSFIETMDVFPNRTNVEFVEVLDRNKVKIGVWERGSGVTLACGTGAAAVAVAGALNDRTERTISAQLPGGEVELEWAEDDSVYLTGPAETVFIGEWTNNS